LAQHSVYFYIVNIKLHKNQQNYTERGQA